MKEYFLIAIAQVVLASSALASFEIIDHRVLVNTTSGTSEFSLSFNQFPDFSTFDEYGRAANQFQFFIIGDESLGYPDNFNSIIRPAESIASADKVIARAVSPSDPDPLSGGWGAILESAPMSVIGNTVSFTLHNSIFNDGKNNLFKYNLEAYEYGAATSYIYGQHALLASVPEPSGNVLLFLGLLMLGAAVKLRAPNHETVRLHSV